MQLTDFTESFEQTNSMDLLFKTNPITAYLLVYLDLSKFQDFPCNDFIGNILICYVRVN